MARSIMFCYVVVFGASVNVLTAIHSAACPKEFCRCEMNMVVCKDNGKRLNYIPRVPNNTEKIVFSGNDLEIVTAKTFQNLSQSNIYFLNLAGNNIRHIESDAFLNFTSLSFLDLSSNKKMSKDDLQLSFSNIRFKRNGTLSVNSLRINDSRISNLFSNLDKRHINVLLLEYNQLETISTCFFKDFRDLKVLKLTGNNLINLTFECESGIELLEIDHNNLNFVPNFCISNNQHNLTRENISAVPHLKVLSMSSNRFTRLSSFAFDCVANIRQLSLLAVKTRYFSSGIFRNFINLEIFQYSNFFTGISNYIEPSLFRNSSIRDISLQKVSFGGYLANASNLNIFEGINYLHSLDLSYCDFPLNPYSQEILFKPISQLSKFKMQFAFLRRIPYQLFDILPRLNVLDLSFNQIETLDFRLITKAQSLKKLYLGNNRLTRISDISKLDLSMSLQVIDLSRNKYVCTCQNIQNLKSLFYTLNVTYNLTIKHYPASYICVYPEHLKGTKITAVDCKWHFETVFHTVVLTFVVCSLILAIAFHFRHIIRFWIYKRYRFRKISKKERQSKTFDGFVIYCEEDKSWLFTYFLPFVEEQHGYKLCIHSRDFQYGKLIVDNIVENMNESRKIVLILSENFAKSRWCQFEVLLAHERFMENGPDSLVSIKLCEIPRILMTNTLEILVKFATHAVWSDYKHNREEFWVKILDCFQAKNENGVIYLKESVPRITKEDSEEIQGNKNLFEQHRHDVKNMLTEISFQVKNMNISISKRMDRLEETIMSDISSLKNKVQQIEKNLSVLQKAHNNINSSGN